jgi:hypothetical protein
MPRGSQFVLEHLVTAPPVRDGPDGFADSGRDRPISDVREMPEGGRSPRGHQNLNSGAFRTLAKGRVASNC